MDVALRCQRGDVSQEPMSCLGRRRRWRWRWRLITLGGILFGVALAATRRSPPLPPASVGRQGHVGRSSGKGNDAAGIGVPLIAAATLGQKSTDPEGTHHGDGTHRAPLVLDAIYPISHALQRVPIFLVVVLITFITLTGHIDIVLKRSDGEETYPSIVRRRGDVSAKHDEGGTSRGEARAGRGERRLEEAGVVRLLMITRIHTTPGHGVGHGGGRSRAVRQAGRDGAGVGRLLGQRCPQSSSSSSTPSLLSLL